MSINLFRWLVFNTFAVAIIAAIAISLSIPEPAQEPKQPPQAIVISLCGETKGVFITSYPLVWIDQYTDKTPEFKALSLIAREARDVYEFEAAEDAECKQLGVR